MEELNLLVSVPSSQVTMVCVRLPENQPASTEGLERVSSSLLPLDIFSVFSVPGHYTTEEGLVAPSTTVKEIDRGCLKHPL